MNQLSGKKLCNRKQFLSYMGLGLISSSALPGFSSSSHTNDKSFPAMNTNSYPIPRRNLNAATEQKESKFYPTPDNPKKRTGYAIVGLGKLTLGNILPAFASCKHSKVVALVSGDAQKASNVADQYGIDPKNIYNYQNFDSIKDNKEIDAVYIVLPNSMHHEFTLRAAAAGKHVLCEKPMANSVQESEEMIEACKKADRKLMIAYRVQYEPNNKMIMEWIRNKEYGTVKHIELFNGQNIGDPTQWRLKKSLAGGGALVDIGIYCLNTCRYLLGEEPDSVAASIHSTPGDDRFKEVEESIFFQLRFPSGVTANCASSYGAHQSRRYRVYSEEAWFGMDPAFPYKGLKTEFSQANDNVEWKSNPSIPEADQFALEIDHFTQCIQHDLKPFTPGEEGLQDHKIMQAIYRSATEQKVIKLDTFSESDVFRGPKPKGEE